MLTGSELLAKIDEITASGKATKSDSVRATGYVSTKADGTERLNFTAFYAAVLEAKGIAVSSAGTDPGRPGRKLSFQCKVQFNGNLLIGKSYTEMLGVKPGDDFQIWLSAEGARLTPLDPAVMVDCELGDEWLTADRSADTSADTEGQGPEAEDEDADTEDDAEGDDRESNGDAQCAVIGNDAIVSNPPAAVYA